MKKHLIIFTDIGDTIVNEGTEVKVPGTELVLRAEEGERYFLLEGDTVLFARETGEDPPLRRRAFRGGAFTSADVEAAPVAYRMPRYLPFCLYDP